MATALVTSPPVAKAKVLNTWKEIATYMGRGVRTVQRYERNFHLPVRRVGGKSRKSVLADSRDLDAWLRSAALGESTSTSNVVSFQALTTIPHAVTEAKGLREQCDLLRAANREIWSSLTANLKTLMEEIQVGLTLTQEIENLNKPNPDFLPCRTKSSR
jgi:hypothetical protein